MEDYRNSNKAKAELAAKQSAQPEKKNTKVTQGQVVKKKSTFKHFVNTFVQEDAKTVGDFVLEEVIEPGIKTIVSDIITNAISMFFWGKSGKSTTTTPASRVRMDYSGIYSRQQNAQAKQHLQQRTNQNTKAYYYDTLTFKNRNDAVAVLERMKEQLVIYQMVSVADFYDFAGVSGNYTDNRYGWTDLNAASISNVPGEGWRIDLPKVVVLE